MKEELKQNIAISSELNTVIVRTDGIVTAVKGTVAETNSRAKSIQKSMSKGHKPLHF